MKKTITLFLCMLVLCACKIDDTIETTSLIGDWKLVEVLADPGDGSGTFNAVQSNKVITFNSDGTLSSNGSICDLSIEANNPTSGIYSEENLSFSSNDCSNPEYNFSFELEGSSLIIYYPCIEPCQAKYRKQ